MMRKLVKKAGIVFCCLALLCVAAGCGDSEKNGEENATMTPTQAVEVTPDATSTPTPTPEPTATSTPTPTPMPTPNPYENLFMKDEAVKNGFTLGTVMNHSQLNSAYYVPMVTSEFQSITAGNEMKAYSLLNQSASQKNPDGMPVMNYKQADDIVAFAQENGIGVRGHVLVWDAYMSDWFYREGYKGDGDYVDEETLKARLKYYIDEVVTHFETEFPGVVYCWDVVNEAVGDGGDYIADDPRHVRTYRNGTENMFRTIIGEDYVEFSFACARETVEKLQAQNPEVSIELFYNDYNTFYDDKRNAIIALVESINSYEKNADGSYKKLCDGIGMQSYIGGYGQQSGCMNTQDITRIEKAVRMFHDLGVKVHVTEMSVRNFQESQMEKHAQFYGKLFQAYKKLNEEENLISNISIWGICDDPYMSKNDYSYSMNGPYCGLFNRGCKRKDAYYEALKALMGPEEIQVPTPEPTATPTPEPTVAPTEDVAHEPAKLETSAIPREYAKFNKDFMGKVVDIEYTTYAYADNGEEVTKHAYVLLPPEYDESKQYNVLYLMHGVGGDETEWGIHKVFAETRCALDNMVYHGDIEPFIVVVPNGRSCVNYTNKSMANMGAFYSFGQELRNDLIPYIDANFATYAEYDENGYDLTVARDHRAMAGLSMGGMQTINIGMGECLDIISYFGAFSAAPTSNTAEVIAEKLQGFEEYDVNYFYNICGLSDGTALASAQAAVTGLDELTDRITDGENFMWQTVAGGHDHKVWNLGIYNFAQIVFK